MAKKATKETSDIFTGLLALATLTTLATTIFVALKCYTFYGTLFTIVQTPR